MPGFWDEIACCCTADGCSDVFTGYCFQFSLSGVSNAPPLLPGQDFPPCSTCANYNRTWLLVPLGPIDAEAQTCNWATCAPGPCGEPVTNLYTSTATSGQGGYVFVMQPYGPGDRFVGFEILGGGVTYKLASTNLSLNGPNVFTLVAPNPAGCQGWPSTISVTAIAPVSRGSQTRTAQSFSTVGNEPDEPNPVVNGPGAQPWEPSANAFQPNGGQITPNPYIWNPYKAVTDWLICQNFGFNIQSNWWITGISIQFKRWCDNQNAAFDDWVTVGLNYVIGSIDGPTSLNEAQREIPWPLFSSQPGADIATYGGQFDDWGNGGTMQDFINSPDWCFAVGANLNAMAPPAKAWVDPTTCQMTVYYVVPCANNCCACPPTSTGMPPRQYKVVFPPLANPASPQYPPNATNPTDCHCGFVSGGTFELNYDAEESVAGYVCSYTLTIQDWELALTITNIGPNIREFYFQAADGSACVAYGGDFSIVLAGQTYVEGPFEAMNACEGVSLTLDLDNQDCNLELLGNPYPTITCTPID